MRSKGEAVKNSSEDSGKTDWDELKTESFDKGQAEERRIAQKERLRNIEAYDLAEQEQAILSRIDSIQATQKRAMNSDNVYFDTGAMDIKSDRPSFGSSDKELSDLTKRLKEVRDAEFRNLHAEEFERIARAKADTMAAITDAENRERNERLAERQRNEYELEQAKRASMTTYDKAEEATDAFIKANPLPIDSARDAYGKEHTEVGLLLRKLERIDNGKNSKQSFLDKFLTRRNRTKVLNELQRYGYNASNDLGNGSMIFNALESDYPYSNGQIGQDRYRDFQMIKFMQSKADRGQLKKMKRHLKGLGFKKLPQKWDDDNFTSHEMSTIESIMQTWASNK